MLRKLFIFTILVLIISTTFIKNYTKKLDEQIFSVKENIDYLNSVKELVQLEHNYLTSPDKLLELDNLYFDYGLTHTSKKDIKIINDISEINPLIKDQNE
tara:strand:- start:103 stop:402 length:300 start_codon:yes stop_codon:yes gene_type:complete